MRIKWKVEAKACISAAAQQSVSLYNNCARVTILDTAVVKIVCCTQEGLLRARSERHPDDTDSLGSQDWPPTRHSRVEKGAKDFLPLRATVWTRRPVRDKPPIDRCLTVTARVRGSVPHTSALVCFGQRRGPAQMHVCWIYNFKFSLPRAALL